MHSWVESHEPTQEEVMNFKKVMTFSTSSELSHATQHKTQPKTASKLKENHHFILLLIFIFSDPMSRPD